MDDEFNMLGAAQRQQNLRQNEATRQEIGVMIDPEYPFPPEAAVKAGYKSVPMLIVAGTQDPFFVGKAPIIAEAKAAGLGNVEWMWDNLRKAIEEQKDSPHKLVVAKAGHVPTVKTPGHPIHNDVDTYIRKAVSSRTSDPFEEATDKN